MKRQSREEVGGLLHGKRQRDWNGRELKWSEKVEHNKEWKRAGGTQRKKKIKVYVWEEEEEKDMVREKIWERERGGERWIG